MADLTPAPAPIDVTDPAVFAHGIPQAAFAEMRANPGLSWTPGNADYAGFWNVTRHDDVVTVSRDTETYSSGVGHIQIYDIDDDALDARASMIDMDPPVHTRLRRLVSAAFTPRHVQSYRAAIRARVCDALDQLEAGGGGRWPDVVSKPIPVGVICDIMGVPEADHDFMVELSDHLVAGTSSETLDPGAYKNTTELRLLPFNSPAAFGMSEYARQLAEKRRAEPGDDLITKLIEAEVDGEQLTDSEFANFFRLMIFAGNETTRSSISHLALHLMEFPAAFEAVAADRSLVEGAAEEVIRYSSPILYFRRTVTQPASLSGTAIAAGEKVVMWYSAANFDESAFPNPLQFDPARRNPPANVAFGGGGAHFCLGASLARLELVELIDEILDRKLQIEQVGEVEYVDSNFVNGIEHLQVRVIGTEALEVRVR